MGEKVIMVAEGDRRVELIEDDSGAALVKISSGGFWTRVVIGVSEKVIPVSQISSIEFRPPGLLRSGIIRFHFPGAGEGIDELNERTVLFSAGEMEEFKAIKEEIERRMALAKTTPRASSNLDELEKLASLRDKGIITEEEFQAKKRQLLGL
jgi:hypothetical protein